MRAALLGAGGLLGRHLREELDGEVRALDRGACDVTQLEAVLDQTAGCQTIINCAAFTDVDGAESRPEEAWRINAVGAENAARAAAAHDVTLVHLSTDFVFDGEQVAPYDERALPNPRSSYARSKHAGEQRALGAHRRVVLVRVQALYGEGGRGFASRLRERIVAGSPLRVDAERRIQPTWARAAARTLVRLANRAEYGTYHVSCGGETTWAGFARCLAERLGVEPAFRAVATAELAAPAARPRQSLFDHRQLRLRGIEPPPSWEIALDEYLAETRRP